MGRRFYRDEEGEKNILWGALILFAFFWLFSFFK